MLITENKRALFGVKANLLAFCMGFWGLAASAQGPQYQAPPYPVQQAPYVQGTPYPGNTAPYQPANYGPPGAWQQPPTQPPMQQQQVAARPATSQQAIKDWFQRYDAVRRQAQMNPADRQKADALMAKGISMFVPGEDKVATQKLLNNLVGRYAAASEQMKGLPLYPETERLHRGYYQYFSSARELFGDYLKVQDNILAKDASGNAVAGTLMTRKQNLETLDQNNKALDAQLRGQFGIAPYKF